MAAKIKAATGVDVDMCYQCGKCTAGCVLAGDMDYPSSMVMRMLQTDDAENYHKILSSNAIWLCQNCENCIGRCPKEVDIPKVMDYLRAESIKAGCVSPKAKPILFFLQVVPRRCQDVGTTERGVYDHRFQNAHHAVVAGRETRAVDAGKGKLNFYPIQSKTRRR